MKENSKEKLERQLNENPELKERFNLQMEGIANRVKTITNVLSIEQFKEIGKLYNNRESDYNSLRNEKKELLKHRGIYAPKYAFEFLDWFFDCYLFGKPMHVKEDEGLSLYHFRLYNEYVARLFEHKNWTDDKERDFLNKQFNNDIEQKDNRNDLNFTALQWSIIFYYVEPDLYGNIEQKKNRLQAFITNFKVNKTLNSLSNKHSEIVRVVTDDEKNELKQIHISAIEKVLPFLKDNYPDAFIDADQDFKRLVDNLDRK